MYVHTPQRPLVAQKEFRRDINGLRALAVAAVVLYHFGITGFSGGFVGVDIFFVISGFLMTSIIVSGMESGSFSLRDFYFARIKRIVPALFILCVVLLIFGRFFLSSSDYKLMGLHVVSAVLFVSNIKFWTEASYFDIGSHEKWLLHTWSLSVEWQFYILLPLGIMLVWRWYGKRGVKLALCILGVLSLALSVYASSRWPTAAFYFLPTRAWEMLAGGMVWWVTRGSGFNGTQSRVLEALGLMLIALSIVFFDANLVWPSGYAVVPVLGTMLVLAAARQHSLITGNVIAQRLGKSSYSIYLWHWPLVVGLAYIGEADNSWFVVVGLVFSILAGELSYKYIEKPAGFSLGRLKGKVLYAWMLVPLTLVLLVVSFVSVSAGANYNWRAGASSSQSVYVDSYSKNIYLTDTVKL